MLVLVTGLFVAFRFRGAGKPANFVAAPTSPGCFRSLSPRLAFGWLLACWVALSTLDVVCQSAPLALNGRVASPVTPIAGDGKLRIGLALSGGGYRAALVHAGVLQELANRRIPVTNVASVSGGSMLIIGRCRRTGRELPDRIP